MEAKVAQVNDLNDGQMMKVMVGERAVLLARVDGQLYATGAVCPHYGGHAGAGPASASARGDVPAAPGHVRRADGHDAGAAAAERHPAVRRARGRHGRLRERAGRRAGAGRDADGRASIRRRDGRTFAVIGGGAGAAAAVEALRQEGFQGPHRGHQPGGPLAVRPAQSEQGLPDRRGAGVVAAAAAGALLRGARHRAAARPRDGARREDADDPPGERRDADPGRGADRDRRDAAQAGRRPARTCTACSPCGRAPTATRSSPRCPTRSRPWSSGASFIGMEVGGQPAGARPGGDGQSHRRSPFERTLGRRSRRNAQALHENNGVAFQVGRTVQRASWATAGSAGWSWTTGRRCRRTW